MGDRYAANGDVETHVSLVPEWAMEMRPVARRMVIGPPRGHDVTGDIRAVEMLVEQSSHGRIFYGYVRVPHALARQMADEDGGWVEIAFWTPQLIPWSQAAYLALPDEADDHDTRDGRAGAVDHQVQLLTSLREERSRLSADLERLDREAGGEETVWDSEDTEHRGYLEGYADALLAIELRILGVHEAMEDSDG